MNRRSFLRLLAAVPAGFAAAARGMGSVLPRSPRMFCWSEEYARAVANPDFAPRPIMHCSPEFKRQIDLALRSHQREGMSHSAIWRDLP